MTTMMIMMACDDDNDGMLDTWEEENGLNPFADDSQDDLDNDGLTNEEEYFVGTDPWATDTDGDTVGDGTEVAMAEDPLDVDSFPDISLATSHLWVTDVTPESFSLVWTSNQTASSFANIYADPEGTEQIRSLSITNESAGHPPAEDNGVLKVDVTGLTADNVYYFRFVTISNEGVLVEPAIGAPLPSVNTEASSAPVTNDLMTHKILQSDGTTRSPCSLCFCGSQ
jgi:hypothetical protein